MNPLLKCNNLTKNYSGTPAVDGLSISVAKGESVSILGPSGCGKTTLLRLIAGFEYLDAGEIKLKNSTVSSNDKYIPPEKRNIGMVFQDYSLFPHMNVAQNIGFGLHNYSKNEMGIKIKTALELVQLTGLEKRYPHELSGGQQQRISLARTLAPNPEIILLDEPFSNLDTITRRNMVTDINKILNASNTASILVTHDREEALSIADTLAVMVNGKIKQIGVPEEIFHSPASIEVANLIIDCTFLNGEISGDLVHTSFGLFPYKSVGNQIIGNRKVKILVRPEDFTPKSDSHGEFKIVSRNFKGAFTIIEVKSIKHNVSINCYESNQNQLGLGSIVNLERTNEDKLMVFSAE